MTEVFPAKRRPGRPFAGGPTPTRSLRIGDVYDAAKDCAKMRGETITVVVERALAEYVAAGRTEPVTSPIRWLLDRDDDGHWYLVSAEAHRAFDEWVLLEQQPDLPDGVISLGSHPNTVTFEKPEHFGKVVA